MAENGILTHMEEAFRENLKNKDETPFREPLSGLEIKYKFTNRIKQLKSRPDLLVRYEKIPKKDIGDAIKRFNNGKCEFDRLNKEYGIAIPNTSFFVGRLEGGGVAMYTAVDKIYGRSL